MISPYLLREAPASPPGLLRSSLKRRGLDGGIGGGSLIYGWGET